VAQAGPAASAQAAPAAPAQGAPTYRALLVGVSEYPQLDKRLWLEGPRNDVVRMRDVLLARGVPAQNIAVLADGVPGAELPTRQRILQELERLAQTARANDYIVIHMGGHGSQQPVPANSPHLADEPDGLFEVFLPRDVENWGNKASGSEGEIRNAILDHEIRTLVDRMTQRGAFVWGIFDACHSATLVRSAGNPEVRMRQVTPRELGIPQESIDRSVARAAQARASMGTVPPRMRGATAGPGQSVFFYAAQTVEPTPEMRLPAGAPDRRSHGLFSYTILEALEGGAGMTYQQLAQQVLTRYGGMSEARATPLFTGTALQSGVMGQAATGPRQWAVIDGAQPTIRAGLLAGVEEGSVLALLPSAVSRDDQAIGYVQVSRSDATGSVLEPVAFNGVAAKPVADLKAGRIARMVRPAVKFEFVVAVDLAGCGKPCPFDEPVAKLRNAGAAAVPGVQMRWVSGRETANIKLYADGRRLWFVPPSMAADVDCASAPDDKGKAACRSEMERNLAYLEATATATAAVLQENLLTSLSTASRATSVLRVASRLSGTATASQLRMNIVHKPRGGKEAPITPARVAQLRPGDHVTISFENTGRTPIDATLLYLDSRFGIGVMFPEQRGSNRLQPGDRSPPIDIEITDSTFGTERLLAVAVEGKQGQERADYSFLEQDPVTNAIVTRGAGSTTRSLDSTEDLLRKVGFGAPATRGARAVSPPAATGMQVYSWQVVPR
jgi:hypothetical protein